MSKKPTVPATDVPATPASIRDSGYRYALGSESLETLVRYVLDKAPGFADECPKPIKEELYAGFQLRKHEIEGDKHYRLVDGGTLIKCADGETGPVVLTVNYAMSFTPSEFGKLRESDPSKHALIKDLRDGFSTYASNKLGDMRRKAKQIKAAGQPRQRAVNKTFCEAMTAAFEAYEKRVKTAHARGETDADPAKYLAARDAFWKTYNA